ncbi:zinc-dependent metalloprotease [Microbacterium sp. MPKO10]|uniref:zinc-dependent metalloprotease n=1 Tax=Microbacterium sp. MPKO10 TaxID=2989818 RepID=UPI0022358BE5|nr:zinc-dependent metalloprotease [Microbacterium sp. MPKO10]MCW4458110.1 zinc-dependent metalloprotease [Microbacterium sp. MPKO10]
MAEVPDEDKNPEDDFQDMIREILSGNAGVDPSKLAGAAGLPSDPASLQAMMMQFQRAMQQQSAEGGINWDVSLEQAVQIGRNDAQNITPAEREQFAQAFHVAELWLADVTSFASLTSTPRTMSRAEWSKATMPLWTQLAEPVATSISDALTTVLKEQAPEQMQEMIGQATRMIKGVGGTMFAMQLGQVVGQLSTEVVSGGDVGIPLLEDEAALVPQNVAAFSEGLDIPLDQVQLYLAVRELAHARLFRHARWLRLHLISSITAFARGIHIDTEAIEELASGFDPSNPEELREAMTNGSLIPPKTDQQLAALERLETTLALIEGWVDVVTAEATVRLPKAGSVAETVRRRRATGGPAEQAFATLVGLELRPRRLREAAAMWTKVTDAVGASTRDSLWQHPDLVPTSADIDDPAALVARLEAAERGEAPEPDEFDVALEDLLRSERESDEAADAQRDPSESDDDSPREDPPAVP